MGASGSKVDGNQDSAKSHVWKTAGPVGVSHDIIETLSGTSETDKTRAQTAELAVQARVAAELRKLSSLEAETLRIASQRASEQLEQEQKEKGEKQQLSRQTVSAEVEALRTRLDRRKQLRQVPETVERARSNVVACLRDHDRRPLNCWREVEAFREEVRRLEKEWVDQVVR